MPAPNQSRPKPSRSTRPATGLESRRAALALIEAALSRRGGMEAAEGPVLAGLDGRDRGFARALALATLRWLGPIDRTLAGKMHKPPPPDVTSLLRLGLAQMLALDTPAHAAVSTTLDLAQGEQSTRPFKKLINAVLRGVDRERPSFTGTDFAPDWLMARWRAAYGDAAEAIAAQILQEPPTDLSLRDPNGGPALAATLDGVVLPGGTVRTPRRGDISAWPGFEAGDWWVQDAAAAIPARLLDVRAGEAVLDLCAAPGGKTMQLAATGARVTALDRSPDRLQRLKLNLARTGLTAETIAADAASWRSETRFDAVLLDAPCSSTGTFRRHPDVLWTCKPPDIGSMAMEQGRLLGAAAALVKPGGRLVYCVCSLEPEEGEAQVQPFLTRNADMTIEPIHAGEGGIPAGALLANGTVRLHPGLADPEGGLDGFFIARFTKSG